jgi:YesN/AraC family two-component response regulator
LKEFLSVKRIKEASLEEIAKVIGEVKAQRLLLYTNKSAKEIGDILGFEDLATFSRFFKKMTGKNISEFRKNV